MKNTIIILCILTWGIFSNLNVSAQNPSFKNQTLIQASDSIFSYSFSITEPFDVKTKEIFISKMRKLIQYRISNIEIKEDQYISFRSHGMVSPEPIIEILNSISRKMNSSDIQ